jgi:hypothetical protein
MKAADNRDHAWRHHNNVGACEIANAATEYRDRTKRLTNDDFRRVGVAKEFMSMSASIRPQISAAT